MAISKFKHSSTFFFSFVYRLLFSLAFYLSAIVGYSQQFTIKNYSKTEGLIQSSTNELFQDINGFIRLTGDKSCSIFNGSTFSNYPHLQNFPNEDVIKVRENLSGKRYLLTKSGKLFIQEANNEYQFNADLPFEDAKINSFVILQDNSILLGNNHAGLVRLNGDSTHPFTTAEGLYSNQIEDIYSDQSNTYIVNSEGINLYKNNKILPLLKNDSLVHKKVINHSTGEFWSFVDSIGIFRYNLANGNRPNIINTQNYWLNEVDQRKSIDARKDVLSLGSSTKFISAAENANSLVWVATNKGLFRIILNPHGEIYIYEVIKNEINTLLVSRNKDVFVTAPSKGLIKVSQSYFENYSSENGFPSSDAKLLYTDVANKIWFSDAHNWLGFYSCELGFRVARKPFDDPNLRAISMTGYNSNNLLISLGEKLVLMSLDGFSKPEFSGQLPNEIKNVVFNDSNNDIWIGLTKEGLWKISEGTVRKIGFHNINIDVLDIFEDRQENLWIRTNKGLFQANDDIIKSTNYSFSQSNLHINTFVNDNKGKLWMGTSDGIYIFKDTKLLDSINFTPDIASKNVTAICQYDRAMLIGTSDGLVLNMDKQFKYFGISEGLSSNLINGSKISSESGVVIFGSNFGITFFYINNYLLEQEPPKIYLKKYSSEIDTITLDNRSFTDTYNITLNKTEDFVTFSLDVINLKNSLYELNYQLINNEDSSAWRKISNNEIFINKPRPGINKLLIRSNFIGQVDTHEIEIYFIVKRAFYNTLAFRISFIVLLLSLLFFALKRYTHLFTKKPKKYTTSSLSKANSKKIKSQIEILFREKQYYRNPDLSLQVLVDELSFSKEHISQVINTEFKSNFNALINTYRVKEACELLKKNKGKKSNILQIGYFVGFNSKSSFNNAFKKQTGYSPTAYQNKYSS